MHQWAAPNQKSVSSTHASTRQHESGPSDCSVGTFSGRCMKSTVSIALRVVHQTPLNERGGSGFRRHRAAHISSEVHVVHDRTSATKKGVLTSRSNIVSRVLDTYFFVIVYSIISGDITVWSTLNH